MTSAVESQALGGAVAAAVQVVLGLGLDWAGRFVALAVAVAVVGSPVVVA